MTFYWSKQHGAYITLITAWLAAVLASHRIYWLQLGILILLLSGFNFSELIAEKYKRKSPLPKDKAAWMLIYFALALITASLILIVHPFLKYFLPFFLAGSVAFAVLSYKRMQKSPAAELLVFALFSLAGLLAYLPAEDPSSEMFITLFISMVVYFGVSIFMVKVRLHKLPLYSVYLYIVFASMLLLGVTGATKLSLALIVLLIIKSLPVTAFYKWYESLKIKTIGMMETASHVVFVVLVWRLSL